MLGITVQHASCHAWCCKHTRDSTLLYQASAVHDHQDTQHSKRCKHSCNSSDHTQEHAKWCRQQICRIQHSSQFEQTQTKQRLSSALETQQPATRIAVTRRHAHARNQQGVYAG
jgi:hypothetical protein